MLEHILEDHLYILLNIYYHYYSNVQIPPLRGWCESTSRKEKEGKTSEKREENKRDRGTEGETPNPISGN